MMDAVVLHVLFATNFLIKKYEVFITVREYNVESVSLDGVTLLKGMVNTQEVFGLSDFDLVPGKYEVAEAINRGTDALVQGNLVLQKASTTRMQVPQLSGE